MIKQTMGLYLLNNGRASHSVHTSRELHNIHISGYEHIPGMMHTVRSLLRYLVIL